MHLWPGSGALQLPLPNLLNYIYVFIYCNNISRSARVAAALPAWRNYTKDTIVSYFMLPAVRDSPRPASPRDASRTAPGLRGAPENEESRSREDKKCPPCFARGGDTRWNDASPGQRYVRYRRRILHDSTIYSEYEYSSTRCTAISLPEYSRTPDYTG